MKNNLLRIEGIDNEKIFKDYASKNFKDFKRDERKEVKEVVKEAKVKAEEHNKEVELNKNEKQFVKEIV